MIRIFGNKNFLDFLYMIEKEFNCYYNEDYSIAFRERNTRDVVFENKKIEFMIIFKYFDTLLTNIAEIHE